MQRATSPACLTAQPTNPPLMPFTAYLPRSFEHAHENDSFDSLVTCLKRTLIRSLDFTY